MLVKFFHFLGELANQPKSDNCKWNADDQYHEGYNDGFGDGFQRGRKALARDILQQLDEFVPDECCIKKEQG